MPADRRPRRIHVVGNSGAGKSTFSRALAARLDVPYLELDEMFWGPHWTKRDPVEARAALRDSLAGACDGWVLDGNWNSTRQGVGDEADVTVWLDYPRTLVMTRLLRRTLRRTLTGQELWHGNREHPRNLVRRDPEENILLWSWGNHHRLRAREVERMRAGVRTIRVRTPRRARRLLETARPAR